PPPPSLSSLSLHDALPIFPVIWIARQRDPFVGLEFDEFERAGADRMLTHLVRRYVAWINHRKAGGEQRDKRRLRSLQMEGNLIIDRKSTRLNSSHVAISYA